MYGYPSTYGQWSPNRRGYLQHLHNGTPLPPPYGHAGVYDTGYYDTAPYYNTMTSPYPGAVYSDHYIPQQWGSHHYGQPYYRGGLLSSLFGYPGRRSWSFSNMNRDQFQEEQLRQLRRQSDSIVHRSNGRSSSSNHRRYDDNKKR
ncbi:hypothetical protein INT44_002045 [Umbelopsis vinacea]|uniref:Uncharacterized protein n=1 Tax=Umbelopsis vinacea TaxID=44442 RepID=A0A8H7UJB6_9FUNG|nr:hypothetical protein INT44_002045 [Umbelopsis vinacea]